MLETYGLHQLIWNTADERFPDVLVASAADAEGRGIKLLVMDNGSFADLSDARCYLIWRHRRTGVRGTEEFDNADAGEGRFTVFYPAAMCGHTGTVDAQIMLSLGDDRFMSTRDGAFREQYGELSDAFDEWRDHACEHEYMELVSERVGNIMGMACLRAYIDGCGEDKFPILTNMFPSGNDGCFPAAKAEAALREIEAIEDEVDKLHEYSLFDKRIEDWSGYSSDQNWHVVPSSSFGEIVEAEFVVESDGKEFRARRFKQELLPEQNSRRDHKARLVKLDYETGEETGEEICVDWSVNPSDKRDTEFIVKEEDIKEFFEWKMSILKRLLNASIETGNPIQWC